ncbi:hypothetical protein KM043_016567 [Ampulex compressa]|nr:hypothetical protein KM043_016567 [Ampulex compressa]
MEGFDESCEGASSGEAKVAGPDCQQTKQSADFHLRVEVILSVKNFGPPKVATTDELNGARCGYFGRRSKRARRGWKNSRFIFVYLTRVSTSHDNSPPDTAISYIETASSEARRST